MPAGTTALDQFTVDLTARAKKGKIDPVTGPRLRDPPDDRHPDAPPAEQPDPHRRGRRRQDRRRRRASRCGSPTATCRRRCANVAVRTLDLGLLQAGAGVKGEFENRLKSVIDEVKASPQPIILFIDEAHTMIGAGGAGRPGRRGQPAQAGARARRAAHDRRHHLGRVQEVLREGRGARAPLPGGQGRGARRAIRPSLMMRGLAPTLEKHHKVRILDEARRGCRAAVAPLHLRGRQLPDKAVSVLDTACARVAIGQSSMPAGARRLPAATRRRSSARSAILEREQATGADHDERLGDAARSTRERPRRSSTRSRRAGSRRRRWSSRSARLRGKLEEPRPARGRRGARPRQARLRRRRRRDRRGEDRTLRAELER